MKHFLYYSDARNLATLQLTSTGNSQEIFQILMASKDISRKKTNQVKSQIIRNKPHRDNKKGTYIPLGRKVPMVPEGSNFDGKYGESIVI